MLVWRGNLVNEGAISFVKSQYQLRMQDVQLVNLRAKIVIAEVEIELLQGKVMNLEESRAHINNK